MAVTNAFVLWLHSSLGSQIKFVNSRTASLSVVKESVKRHSNYSTLAASRFVFTPLSLLFWSSTVDAAVDPNDDGRYPEILTAQTS